MGTLKLVAVTEEDYAAILELNEASTPHVNSIPGSVLEHLHRQSCYCKVAKEGDQIVGFLVVLAENAHYDSPNFQYFKRHYSSFAYVDRIFVRESHHGRGIGATFYGDLIAELGGEKACVTCEVNLRPPNPGSIAFHERMGFRRVAEQDTEGGAKRVSLMVLDLGNETGPASGIS
jgi:predicted GNAT superfamily acetyltransferase